MADIVNPDAVPELNSASYSRLGELLTRFGSSIDSSLDTIQLEWGKLRNCYEAPEQEQVYALMDGPASDATELSGRTAKAATALDAFAEKLAAIDVTLTELKAGARAFADFIDGGGCVRESEASPRWSSASGNHHVPGIDLTNHKWSQCSSCMDRNDEWIGRIAEQLESASAAEVECAQAISGLLPAATGGNEQPQVITAEMIRSLDNPWGTVAGKRETSGPADSVLAGLEDLITEIPVSLAVLIGGYDTVTNRWGQSHVYEGTGEGFRQLGDTFTSDPLLALGMIFGPMIKLEPGSEDPGQEWTDDPWRAGTYSVANVALFFLPVVGWVNKAAKAAKGAGGIRAVGAIAVGSIADAVPFARRGLHYAAQTADKFFDVSAVTHLDNLLHTWDGVPVPTHKPLGLPDRDLPTTPPKTDLPAADTPTTHLPDSSSGKAEPPTARGAGPQEDPAGPADAATSGGGSARPPAGNPAGPADTATSSGGSARPPAGDPAGEAPPAGPRSDSDPAASSGSPDGNGTTNAAREGTPDSPSADTSPEVDPSRRLYDPDSPAPSTIPAKEAPHPYTQADVERALDNAPVNDKGDPVDPRTGEPLNLTDAAGHRGWEMRWDPDAGDWAAQNRGSGLADGLPAKGEPGSFGYDANGDRLPYANYRPDYAPGQEQQVWDAARAEQLELARRGLLEDEAGNPLPTPGDDQLWIKQADGSSKLVTWKQPQSRDGLWDMGHIPKAPYNKLRHEYLSGNITQKEFLDAYRDPNNYAPEDPLVNRSHMNEIP
ncbi:MAG: GH-E family nuclease [Arachnia sp.]